MSSVSKRGFSPQDLLTLFLSSLFLTLTVLFFSPMELILINARDFRFSFQDVWLLQLAVAVVSAGVLTGIILLFLRNKGAFRRRGKSEPRLRFPASRFF